MSEEKLEARLLDVNGLHQYLSIPNPTIYAWVKSGKIPAEVIVRLGKSLRFDRVKVDQCVSTLEARHPRASFNGA